MKKIINIFMICLTFLLCGIVGCNNNNNASPQAFNDSQGLEYYPLDNDSFAVSLGKARFLKNIVVPEKFNNKPVTTIIGSPYAGSGNIEIEVEAVSLPNSLTSIGILAFNNFTNLKKIIIPSNTTVIEFGAFNNCKSLQEVSISDSVTSIGDYAFQFCNNLKNIKLSKNLEVIGEYAFSCCEQLNNIQLPEKLKSIGKSAFQFCTNINIILSTNNETNYHENAFLATNEIYQYHSIFYLGNQEHWNKLITSCFFNYNEVYFYSTTYQEGNYWHYDTDDKTPVKWNLSA